MAEPESVVYETVVFDLKPDSLGPNRATLLIAKSSIRSENFDKAILYIHGYSDYFFQDHVSKRFLEKGFDFYALDLRKCGRSIILPEQHKNRHYCRDLREYDEEIDLSIDLIVKNSAGKEVRLFLLGHSTGGLIASIYSHAGSKRDRINGIILNSPYLSPLKMSWAEALMVSAVTTLNISVDIPDNWYGRSIHRSVRGEWDFDVEKKSIDKLRLHGAFHWAVQQAQNALKRGEIKVECPVLMLCSTQSIRAGREWRDEYGEADLVLNVRTMKEIATVMASQLTISEIAQAKHDVFLSKESARENAFEQMFQWLDRFTK